MDPTFGIAAASLPHGTQRDLSYYRFRINEIVTRIKKEALNYDRFVNEIVTRVEKLEKQVHELDVSRMKAAASKKTNALMLQISTILDEIIHHELAWPFMDPVDVEGLGLHDFELICKPMGLSMIKRKMDAKDGSGYKSVPEIYSDVRSIFEGAMKYNDEKNNIHAMAKALLDEFEKKWQHLFPKLAEAETGPLKEAHVQLDTLLSQEATFAKMAMALSDVDINLTNLKATIMENFRKLSGKEKDILARVLPKLSHENLIRAVQIISENNPSFDSNANEVVIDIDAQSDDTLWKLVFFVKKTLDNEARTAKCARPST